MIYIQVIILKNLAPTTYGICNGTFVTVKGLLYENDDNLNKWLLPVCVFVNVKEFGNYFGEILISKILNFHSIDDKLLTDIEIDQIINNLNDILPIIPVPCCSDDDQQNKINKNRKHVFH